MSGRVLEFKGEREYNAGKEDGRREGQIELLIDLAYEGLLDEEAAADVAQKRGSSKEKFKEMLHSYSTLPR